MTIVIDNEDMRKRRRNLKISLFVVLFLIVAIPFTSVYGIPFLPHDVSLSPPVNQLDIGYFPNYNLSIGRENNTPVEIQALRTELRIGNIRVEMVGGNSMYPTIQDGDIVLFQTKFNDSDVKVGLVVAYQNVNINGGLVHRIVWRDNQSFIAKGDGNMRQDPGKQDIATINGIVVARYIPVVEGRSQ